MPTYATREHERELIKTFYHEPSIYEASIPKEKDNKIPEEQLKDIVYRIREILDGKRYLEGFNINEVKNNPINFREKLIFALMKLVEAPLMKESTQQEVHQTVISFSSDQSLITEIKYAYQEEFDTTLWEDLIKNSGLGHHRFDALRIFSNQKRGNILIDARELSIQIQHYFKRYEEGSKKDLTPLHELEEFLLLQLKMHPDSVLKLDEEYRNKNTISLREKWATLPKVFASRVDDILPVYYLDELKYNGKVEVDLSPLKIYIHDFEEGLDKANLLLSNRNDTSQNKEVFNESLIQVLEKVVLEEVEGYGLVRDRAGKYSFLQDVSDQLLVISLNEEYVCLRFPLHYILETAKVSYDPAIIEKEIAISERKREEYIQSKPKSDVDYQGACRLIYGLSKKTDWSEPSSFYYYYDFISRLLPNSAFQPYSQDQKLRNQLKKENTDAKDLRAIIKKIQNHPPSIDALKHQFKLDYNLELLPFLEKYLHDNIAYFNYILADISPYGKEDVNEENIAYEIADLLWEHQYYLDEIKNDRTDQGELTEKKRILIKKLQALLIQLENNPANYQRMLYYYPVNNLTKELQQYHIYEDLKHFIPTSYVHRWIAVRTIGKKSQSIDEIEGEVKVRERKQQGKAKGVIFEYFDYTFQQNRYRYLVAENDTLDEIAQRTKTKVDDIVKVNNWKSIDPKSGKIMTQMGISMHLKSGNYIHLPEQYLPEKGNIFYKEEQQEKGIRYVAVQKQEGFWQSTPIQLNKEDNVKEKLSDYLDEEFLGNKKVNGFGFNLEIMVEGKVYALVNIAFKMGSELNIKTSDTRSVNVSLSVMPAIGFSLGKGDYKVGVEAGLKFSLDYFRVLNGSYTSYSHFLAFLQLAFFQTFTNFSKGINLIEEWDEDTWKELSKGYTRKELNEYYGSYAGNFSKKDAQKNTLLASGSKYKLTSSSASSYKVKGLDQNLFKRDSYEQERAVKNWEPNEKKALRDDRSYSLTAEKTIGNIKITHEVKETQFSTNQNNLGETNTFEIETVIPKLNAQSLQSFTSPEIINLLKNIGEAVRSFNPSQGLDSILNNVKIDSLLKNKENNQKDDIRLVFKVQLLSEEDLLPNLQYVRMSIKGNVGFIYQNPQKPIKIEGTITGEHEIAEQFGTGTISYISSVFNAINSEKGSEYGLDTPKFSSTYNEFIQEATDKAKDEHLRYNKRLTDVNTKIPTLSDLLKSYQQDQRLLEIRNTLLQQTLSEWKGFIGKDNADYDTMIEDFAKNIKEVVLEYVNEPNRRVWKWSDIAGDINGLSEKQCEYYLGDMYAIGEYYFDKSNRKNQEEYRIKTSNFFKSIFNKSIIDVKPFFEEDILFPLFIENKVYSNISYNG